MVSLFCIAGYWCSAFGSLTRTSCAGFRRRKRARRIPRRARRRGRVGGGRQRSAALVPPPERAKASCRRRHGTMHWSLAIRGWRHACDRRQPSTLFPARPVTTRRRRAATSVNGITVPDDARSRTRGSDLLGCRVGDIAIRWRDDRTARHSGEGLKAGASAAPRLQEGDGVAIAYRAACETAGGLVAANAGLAATFTDKRDTPAPDEASSRVTTAFEG